MCEEKLFFWKFYGIRKDICIANKRGVKMIKFSVFAYPNISCPGKLWQMWVIK